jgi:cbb3-type cytochrome oxidase subunit 3
MTSSGTLHVVATELVVGAYALAGIAFAICLLAPYAPAFLKSKRSSADTVAHAALSFGLIATPFAIFTGLSSAPNGEMSSALLANKMLFSLSGLGLALGTLTVRWRMGSDVWVGTKSTVIHGASGLGSTALMLLTASAGGTYARGESLLDWLHLPYEEVLLMPTALSAALLLIGLACSVIGFRSSV